MIARLTGFRGDIRWQTVKPDGQPRRRLDVSRAREKLQFQAKVPLEQGLRTTIAWFETHKRLAKRANVSLAPKPFLRRVEGTELTSQYP